MWWAQGWNRVVSLHLLGADNNPMGSLCPLVVRYGLCDQGLGAGGGMTGLFLSKEAL